MRTAGWLEQDSPNSDAQIFLTPTDFQLQTNASLINAALGANNLPAISNTAAGAFAYNATIAGLLLRTGILNTGNFATNRSQNAFGTAAATPGPSAVAGTSGPSGFGAGQTIAPMIGANLPTLKGSIPGSIPKGVQINSVDLLYSINTTNSVSFTGALSRISFGLGVNLVPSVAALMAAQAVGSLVITTAGQITRSRLTPTTAVMITNDGSAILLNIAGNNATIAGHLFLGAILNCSYNYN